MSDVGVVIIGLNEAHNLPRCVASVAASSLVPARTVYVDSGSDDGSEAIAGALGCETLRLDRKTASPGKGRNAGLESCDEPLVQFVDGDMVLDPSWLEQASAYLRSHDECACVFGRTVEDRSGGHTWMDDLVSVDWEGRVPGPASAPAGGGMFVAERLAASGGYDEALSGAEETELGRRLACFGAIVALDLPMAVHRSGMTSVGQLVRRFVRTGYSRGQLLARGKQAGSLWETVRPEVYLVLAVVSVALGVLLHSVLPVALVLAAVIALGTRQYVRIERRVPDRRRALLAATATYASIPVQAWGFVRGVAHEARRGLHG